MSAEKIWEQMCVKSPELRNPESRLEFTAANLKKLIEQVHSKGWKAGYKLSKDIGDIVRKPNPLSDIFGGGL